MTRDFMKAEAAVSAMNCHDARTNDMDHAGKSVGRQCNRAGKALSAIGSLVLLTVFLFGATLLAPELAEAQYSKKGSCTNCHTAPALAANASVLVAVDGTVLTPTTHDASVELFSRSVSVSIPASTSFEVDFTIQGINRDTGVSDFMGNGIFMPPTWEANGGTAPVKGTANSPGLAGWNAVWDGTDARMPQWLNHATASGGVALYDTLVMYGQDHNDLNGDGATGDPSAWHATKGLLTNDGATAADLDGSMLHGADAVMTTPSVAGDYIFYIIGAGGDGAGGGKGYTSTKLTITVTAGSDVTAPTDGATFTATGGQDGQVPLSWDPATDDTAVDHYRVVYDTVGYPSATCTDGTEIYNALGTSTTHTPATNDTLYYYRVCAYDAAANVSAGLTGTATPVAPDVTAPTDGATFTATGGQDGQVPLSWDPATDDTAVDHYRVVYDTVGYPSATCTDGTEIYNALGTSTTHTPATNDTLYYYRVCAYDAAANVSTGLTATATPSATCLAVQPTGLAAPTITATSADLTWTDDAANTFYRVYRDSSQVNTDGVDTTGAYTDSTLSPNTSYSFEVSGYDNPNSCESSLSTAVNVLTRPGAPGNPTYSAQTDSTLRVNWTAPAGGAVSYDVYRDAAYQGNTASLFYDDSGLNPSTGYNYYVIAKNATGDGAQSGTTVGTTTAAPCTATTPGDLATGTIGAGSVDLSWTYDGGNNTYYNVYRDGVKISTDNTVLSGAYTDSTAAANTSYNYTVRGHNGTCEASDSNTAAALTLPGAPGAPTYSNQTYYALRVNWTAPTGGAASYDVYRGGVLQGNTAGLFYDDSGLLPGDSNNYYVIAKNATGDGAASSTTAGSTLTDSTLPTVTAFAVPATHNALAVPITTFTGSDDDSAKWFIIKEDDAVQPLVGDAWQDPAPGTFNVSGEGTFTLYAWVKDRSGNISAASLQDTVTVTLPVPCTRVDPEVSVNPSARTIAADGGVAIYTVTVKNMDTGDCVPATSDFALGFSDTNGADFYASSTAHASLDLAPGDTGVTTLRVRVKTGLDAVSNISDVTATEASHNPVTSNSVTTSVNLAATSYQGGGAYLNANGDKFVTER